MEPRLASRSSPPLLARSLLHEWGEYAAKAEYAHDFRGFRGYWSRSPALAHLQRPTGDFSSFYYFFMAIVVIRYETKTAARRALTFVVRIFVNDTIAITVWTRFYFHVAARASGSDPACSCSPWYGLAELPRGFHVPDCLVIDIGCLHALINKPPCSLRQCTRRLCHGHLF
jgi:hypothetical protein